MKDDSQSMEAHEVTAEREPVVDESADISSWLGKIHNTDCVSGMQSLAASSVDLVFADPPFNIGYKYDEYDDRLDSERYLEWSQQWMSQVHRVLKPNGTFG